MNLTSTAGNVDIDSGAIVDIDGATGVQINSTANDVDITAAVNLTNTSTTGSITNAAGTDINKRRRVISTLHQLIITTTVIG